MYIYGRGVDRLKGPLHRLLRKVKDLFPDAKIYIQSLLPIQIQDQWTVRNVMGINAMIKQCCYEFRLYYINVFNDFLLPSGFRNNRLFNGPVHPTVRAVGLIAKRFINIIHPRRSFNPEVY